MPPFTNDIDINLLLSQQRPGMAGACRLALCLYIHGMMATMTTKVIRGWEQTTTVAWTYEKTITRRGDEGQGAG